MENLTMRDTRKGIPTDTMKGGVTATTKAMRKDTATLRMNNFNKSASALFFVRKNTKISNFQGLSAYRDFVKISWQGYAQ